MNPFEYLNHKKNLLVEAAKTELGKNGLWEICSVITEAINQGISELDLKMVSNFGDIKKDRANKIMPHAQKILIEYRENLQKNSGLSQDNVEIISRKSQDFDASSPHGSIKDKSKIERSPHGEEKENIVSSGNSAKKPRAKSKLTEAPDDLPISEQMQQWADKNGFTQEEILQEVPNFLDHHRSKGNQFLCWESALKPWMRNSKKFQGPKLVKPIDQSSVVGSDAWKRRFAY